MPTLTATSTDQKSFRIKDPVTGEDLDVTMTLLDFIKFKQMNQLIDAIRRVASG